MTEAHAAPAPAPKAETPGNPARHDLPWLRPVLLFCVLGLYVGNALCTSVVFKLGAAFNHALSFTGIGLLLLVYGHYARGKSRWRFRGWLLAPVLGLACVMALPSGFPSLGWNAHPLAGRWIVLAMLAAGSLAALVYLADAAVRRVRLSLGAWLILLLAHAAGMVLVSRYFAWRAGVEGAGAAVWSVELAFLALALALLLLRAGVVAARSAEWWPAWLVHGSVQAHASSGSPLRFPRLPVVLLYACSPLLWWLAGLQLLEISLSGAPSGGGAALFALVWGGLCLRAACAAGAVYGAESALRKARRSGDVVLREGAEAFLFRNGYAWAGLLAIYAYFLTAQRVQQNELARVLQATEAPLVAEMRAMQPAATTPRGNAASWYRQALSTLPATSTYKIFADWWLTPDDVRYVRSAGAALASLEVANRLSGCEWRQDFGASVEELQKSTVPLGDFRDLTNLLLLKGRYAGFDRDWAVLLADVHGALSMARRLQSSPDLFACLIGFGLEEDAVMALLPALLWHPDGPAEEAWLAKAQQMLLEYEKTRGRPLAESVRCYTLLTLRTLNRDHATRGQAWPGGADLGALRLEMPLLAWLDRERFIAWQERLHALAAAPPSAVGLEVMRAQDASHRYGLSADTCVSDWQIAAELRLGRAALASARYRLAHGSWPKDLVQCIPEFLDAVPGGMCEPGGGMRIALDPPRIWYGPPSFDPAEHLRFTRERDSLKAVGPRGRFDGAFFLEPPTWTYGEIDDWKLYDQCEIGREQAALKDPSAAVWEEAARHLATLGNKAWSAREDVFAMAGEPVIERRMWAAFLIGTLGHAEDPAGTHLERLVKDSDPDVARIARWSRLWLRTIARRAAEAQESSEPKGDAAETLKE